MAKRDEAWRTERLLDRLRTGHIRKVAIAAAGIDEGTFRLWLVEIPGFRERVTEAEMSAVEELEDVVLQEARTDPKLALAVLERRHPEDYGRTDKVRVKHMHEVLPVQKQLASEGIIVDIEELTDAYEEELRLGNTRKRTKLPALPPPEALPEREVVDAGHGRYHK